MAARKRARRLKSCCPLVASAPTHTAALCPGRIVRCRPSVEVAQLDTDPWLEPHRAGRKIYMCERPFLNYGSCDAAVVRGELRGRRAQGRPLRKFYRCLSHLTSTNFTLPIQGC
jgi:hypothetical protein